MEELNLKGQDEKLIITISKALSSKTRFQILKLLIGEEMDISRLAVELSQTEANISAQVNQLERAGLIVTRYEPGSHGVRKLCRTSVNKINIFIVDNQ